jgi:MYXO-CTERM domain-containing protein
MDLLLIILIVVAVLALSGWGYSYYGARPVAVTDVSAAPASGPSPLIHLIGVLGLLALVAFIVLWATGWHFGFQAMPPR